MCGIAGVLGATEAAAQAAISQMVCAQHHRGPDDDGTFVTSFADTHIGLGHNRLSILDLSPLGHQPMIHPESGDVLIFNGEIYNFRALRKDLEREGEQFRSTGDTEVLLRGLTRHGARFLDKLDGMYALAFLRLRENELLLARDPMGIKPLYLGRHQTYLVFASEVRTVLSSGLIPPDIDRDGLAGVLSYGAVQHPRTIFQNVTSFPPGHYQILKPGEINQRNYVPFWTYPSIDETLTEPEVVRRIRMTMDVAVRDHLESDVPTGVFLSSGLDSTVVAALAAKHSRDVRSFTVGFSDEPDLSELALARETAKLFGLRHTEVHVNGDTAETAMVNWMQSMDQPSVDGLNVYIISQAVRELGIKVALSGQGGDELFGGYPSFRDVPRMSRWIGRSKWLPIPLRVAVGQLATLGRSDSVRRKMSDVMRSDGSAEALCLQRRRMMSASQLRQLGLSEDIIKRQNHLIIAQKSSDALTDEVGLISQFESSLYQGNMLLRDGDSNGMAHGLEIRVPIIDRRMLDLMHQVPGRLRLPSGLANKHLLRLAFAPYLRSSLLMQAKRGFTLPIRRWMNGPLRDLCEHALIQLKNSNVFDSSGIDEIWDGFLRSPESPIWTRAFVLCVIGLHLQGKNSVPQNR